jgi:hypothetical protein
VPSDILPPSSSQLAPDSRTGNLMAHVAGNRPELTEGLPLAEVRRGRRGQDSGP